MYPVTTHTVWSTIHHVQNDGKQLLTVVFSSVQSFLLAIIIKYLIVGIDPINGIWNFGITKIHIKVGFTQKIH